ncbi:MAG TPA: transcription termination/antitermination protein NusG [Peptococcaceae bacterium]|jgi:transcriptional antiterminator NusG|nr:transcription termination/antitermination protein NusG [Clostridia bacterium]HOB82189.1 transcription termination/antitermination protein NusG [Peptococcaceae bacterium]HPZ71811.1 transcription termination/antitermination protein NusG [Peptococcaceae bacterium]HQD53954.1 transcription termination/antitermination protein NusG [Peptococcaceae bacterium]
MEKGWYVIHTYSGYENKVKTNLEKRVESMNVGDKIFRILVPMEDEVEIKDGKKKTTKKKVFPGYVLVEMILTDESWYVVRNTPGVTGFVGTGAKPIPLLESEINEILRHMGMDEAKPKVVYQVGESVQVKTGPFQNFIGSIEEVYPDKGKIKVLVAMFGRETPVELDYGQVQKLD